MMRKMQSVKESFKNAHFLNDLQFHFQTEKLVDTDCYNMENPRSF